MVQDRVASTAASEARPSASDVALISSFAIVIISCVLLGVAIGTHVHDAVFAYALVASLIGLSFHFSRLIRARRREDQRRVQQCRQLESRLVEQAKMMVASDSVAHKLTAT